MRLLSNNEISEYDLRKRQVDFAPRKRIRPYIVLAILVVLLLSILLGLLILQPASANDGDFSPTMTAFATQFVLEDQTIEMRFVKNTFWREYICWTKTGTTEQMCLPRAAVQRYLPWLLPPLPTATLTPTKYPTQTPDPNPIAYPGPQPYPEPIVAYPGVDIYGSVYAVPDVQEDTPSALEVVVEKIMTWIVSLGNKKDKGK